MQKTAILVPRRNFKTTGRWHKKWANKAGINLKYRTLACKQYTVQHLCTARPAGREIDQTVTRKALKKITNAIRKTHNCTNDEIEVKWKSRKQIKNNKKLSI
jgi:hypothetical protein